MKRAIRKEKKELAELANEFINASVSAATRRAYRGDWDNFTSFCAFHKVNPLPASIETITMFLTQLADSGKATTTIVRSLTSLNKAHDLAGYESIRSPDTKQLIKGIKRTLGKPTQQVKGITFQELLKMAELCNINLLGTRDRAVLMLGWCSALRRSELVALNIGDLEFSTEGIILTVVKSKTDQEGTGQTIGIPYSKEGICPVKSVINWIDRIPSAERTIDNPLFRAIGTQGKTMWATDVFGRLSARMVSETVKRYAALCGLNPEKYSSHSLRRGLATEAGARNIPERIIARHTRHISMKVLRQYIEAGNIWIENPLTAIYTPGTDTPHSVQ